MMFEYKLKENGSYNSKAVRVIVYSLICNEYV